MANEVEILSTGNGMASEGRVVQTEGTSHPLNQGGTKKRRWRMLSLSSSPKICCSGGKGIGGR